MLKQAGYWDTTSCQESVGGEPSRASCLIRFFMLVDVVEHIHWRIGETVKRSLKRQRFLLQSGRQNRKHARNQCVRLESKQFSISQNSTATTA